jgi:hypothetical protein
MAEALGRAYWTLGQTCHPKARRTATWVWVVYNIEVVDQPVECGQRLGVYAMR